MDTLRRAWIGFENITSYFTEGGVLYEEDSRIRSDDGSRRWRC